MKMLTDPGLARVARDKADTLSLGDRTCLEFGMVLATSPKLLLLDEPNEGLAPKIIDEVIAAILKFKEAGMAMLVSEQSLRTSRACGDRVVGIDRGRSVFHGTEAEFLGDPEIAPGSDGRALTFDTSIWPGPSGQIKRQLLCSFSMEPTMKICACEDQAGCAANSTVH